MKQATPQGESPKKRNGWIDLIVLAFAAAVIYMLASCGSIRGTVGAAITVHDSTNIYGSVTRNPDGTYTYRLSHEGCRLLSRYIKTDTTGK